MATKKKKKAPAKKPTKKLLTFDNFVRLLEAVSPIVVAAIYVKYGREE